MIDNTENPRVTRHLSPVTTDPQHELFDVLDSDGEPTGEQKPRWQVHRDGDWHAALHIWVYGVRDDGTPFVLFQRRSRTKDTWPDYLDVAVGGHLRAGESLIETAREAEEELGLVVTLADLIPIGRHFFCSQRDGVIDRELHHVFAIRRDDPLETYVLHPEEVSAIVAIPIAAALQLFKSDVDEIFASERQRSGASDEDIVLRRTDFAGLRTEYPMCAITTLAEMVRGEHIAPFELRTTQG